MTVTLRKNSSVSLQKQAGSTLTGITLGVGWDVATSGSGFMGKLFGGGQPESIDLDASCILFDGSGKPLDIVYFGQLNSKDGSVRHSGDNLTGEGDGDDESIAIDLTRLPDLVETLVLTVNSFRGQTFDKIQNAYGRVVNSNGTELARFDISDSGPHTGLVLASVTRNGGDWTFKAIGARATGRTAHDLTAEAARHI
ncbi:MULTISPECIES: TerD family protein [Sphingobium]|jgi:tellurium resistance protein TerZ|uniref:TerD family protein n=1 Tax=Sphingobium TaxID=165695 RepID=UPI000477191F|nr:MULTISPECIES: TerD family protein [Sphingobium]